MTAVDMAARGDEKDSVTTNHGCTTVTKTEECSKNVFVGIGDQMAGVVRFGDKVKEHTFPPTDTCPSHQPTLTVASKTVIINEKGAGRRKDKYKGGEEISTGYPTVWIGGG